MSDFDFTEDEICEELRKLGYIGVPREKILQFKKDLDQLIREQKYLTPPPSISQSDADLSKENLNPNVPISVHPRNIHQPHIQRQHPQSNQLYNKNFNNDDDGDDSYGDNYDDGSVRSNSTRVSTCSTVSSSSTAGLVIKRKVLRKINGKSHIEESFATDDSSITTSEYTGSSSTRSYRNKSVPNSSHEYAPSSVIRHVPSEQLTKLANKCDPVKRYQEYKRYWAENLVPGEKQHRQLRWDVREYMNRYVPTTKNSTATSTKTKKPSYPPVDSYICKRISRTYLNDLD